MGKQKRKNFHSQMKSKSTMTRCTKIFWERSSKDTKTSSKAVPKSLEARNFLEEDYWVIKAIKEK